MIRFITRSRDLLLLGLLILMVHVAMKEYPGTAVQSSHTPLYSAHEPSLAEYINQLITQIETILSMLPAESPEVEQLKEMKHELSSLAQESTFPHPAYILLGPIASTGIALKEQRIEKKVIPFAQRVGEIAAHLFNKKYTDIQRSFAEQIKYNETLISADSSSADI